MFTWAAPRRSDISLTAVRRFVDRATYDWRARDRSTDVKDIAVLEAALREAPNNPRNTFYLAQSYRDSGKLAESRATYGRLG